MFSSNFPSSSWKYFDNRFESTLRWSYLKMLQEWLNRFVTKSKPKQSGTKLIWIIKLCILSAAKISIKFVIVDVWVLLASFSVTDMILRGRMLNKCTEFGVLDKVSCSECRESNLHHTTKCDSSARHSEYKVWSILTLKMNLLALNSSLIRRSWAVADTQNSSAKPAGCRFRCQQIATWIVISFPIIWMS